MRKKASRLRELEKKKKNKRKDKGRLVLLIIFQRDRHERKQGREAVGYGIHCDTCKKRHASIAKELGVKDFSIDRPTICKQTEKVTAHTTKGRPKNANT